MNHSQRTMTPHFVAELSCNHLGSLDRAFQLVDAAASAGADAIKVQCWSDMVLNRSYVIEDGPWKGRNLAELYDEAKTPWEWIPLIFERAKEQGIEAFSSVFDLKALEFLESIGCPRYKISSFELGDLELIRTVARTLKPVILSTGMATHEEAMRAVDAVMSVDLFRDITVLKCSSAYPAPLSGLNLSVIPLMASNHDPFFGLGVDVGFSDHTIGHTAAVVATALGATMIEKHLTLKRSDGGPDAGFSAEPGEFYEMVKACKVAAEALGDPDLAPSQAEMPQRKLRRSLYYAKDIPEGTVLDAGHFTTARPAEGLEPHRISEMLGRKAKWGLLAGDAVMLEDC